MPNPKKPRTTPRKRAGKAEPPSAGPDDTLFDDAPVAMHEIDRNGIILRVNRAECALLGFAPEELLDRHVSEFVALPERKASREAVRRKLCGEQPLTPFLREVTRRDGARLILEIHENHLHDASGQVAGMRSALLDVTERHRAQEQLQQAREELEARVRERTLELARANQALQTEVAERRRAEQRLAVQYAVARVLADSDSAEEALPRLLEAICGCLDWPLAAYWAADPQGGTLRFRAAWLEPGSPDCRPLLRESAFAVRQGVPGAVWHARQPSWIEEPIETALNLPGTSGQAGYRTGLAFPVAGGAGVLGVMAFFSRTEQPRDEELLRIASLLGSQIGQHFERQGVQHALGRSEARFTAFMEHLPGVAFMKDRAGRYLYVNRAMGSLVGAEPESVLGKTDRDLWPAELAGFIMAHDRQVLATGQAIEILEDLPRGAAQRSWLVYKFPVPGPDGRPFCLGGVAVDVTERRLLEDQLRQSQKMDAIGRLAGGVAHDFNNLLTIIGGYGRMVLEQLPPGDRTRGSMELILNSADRAAVLTSQLLAFSRRQVVKPKLIQLNHVVSNLEKMLRRVIGEHLALGTVLDPNLPRIKADSGQIEQILMNLAINARDAMPEGGTLTIRTANVILRGAAQVQLSVIDTGTGMDEQTKSRLFEPFFTTKGRGKGTGLGLSTVYGIIKQHGGEIQVESAPGAGTHFDIYFPAAAEQPDAAATEQASRGTGGGSETILLVEDDAGVRRLARDTLRAAGYRVIEAANGQEALRLAEREPARVHLLVADMIMPLMSGREVANRLLQRDKNLRVIFMSGYTDDVIAYHGDLGPDTNFLQKPFAPEVLTRKVREVLDAGRGAAKASPGERS